MNDKLFENKELKEFDYEKIMGIDEYKKHIEKTPRNKKSFKRWDETVKDGSITL